MADMVGLLAITGMQLDVGVQMTSEENVLLIDPQTAGVAGDMILGALVDLGADLRRINRAISEGAKHLSNCDSVSVEAIDVHRYGIRAKKIIVNAKEKYHHRDGGELLNALEKLLSSVKVSPPAKKFAMSAMEAICVTEGALHSQRPDEVELHEMGSVDTIVDIGGVAVAMDTLGYFENTWVYSLPVNIGSGKVKTSHGVLSAPTIDATELLKQASFPFETEIGGSELATPTGVTILTHLAQPVEPGIQIKPVRIGYGAGARELDFAPNILRIIVGSTPKRPIIHNDRVTLIETNVDDIDGEVAGYLIEKLMKEGALHVWIVNAISKKNRPEIVLNVLVDDQHANRIANLIFHETGTLGLRISNVARLLLSRESDRVNFSLRGKTFKIRVKTARDQAGNIIKTKPEFDDAKKIAQQLQMPLRSVLAEVHRQIQAARNGSKTR